MELEEYSIRYAMLVSTIIQVTGQLNRQITSDRLNQACKPEHATYNVQGTALAHDCTHSPSEQASSDGRSAVQVQSLTALKNVAQALVIKLGLITEFNVYHNLVNHFGLSLLRFNTSLVQNDSKCVIV